MLPLHLAAYNAVVQIICENEIPPYYELACWWQFMSNPGNETQFLLDSAIVTQYDAWVPMQVYG